MDILVCWLIIPFTQTGKHSRELPAHGQLERLYILLECREHVKDWKKEREGETAVPVSAAPVAPL